MSDEQEDLTTEQITKIAKKLGKLPPPFMLALLEYYLDGGTWEERYPTAISAIQAAIVDIAPSIEISKDAKVTLFIMDDCSLSELSPHEEMSLDAMLRDAFESIGGSKEVGEVLAKWAKIFSKAPPGELGGMGRFGSEKK